MVWVRFLRTWTRTGSILNRSINEGELFYAHLVKDGQSKPTLKFCNWSHGILLPLLLLGSGITCQWMWISSVFQLNVFFFRQNKMIFLRNLAFSAYYLRRWWESFLFQQRVCWFVSWFPQQTTPFKINWRGIICTLLFLSVQ